MAGGNTHREALLAELLGDVQGLLDRVDELRTGLPATVEAAGAQLRKTVQEATEAVQAANVALSRSIDRQAKDAVVGVQEAAREAKQAAVVRGAGSRLVALLVGLALLAGCVAGGTVALLLRHTS
ncbi:MAG: hypothetical protein V3Q69_13880 (plasmid) [Burkholderia sp.]